MTRVSKPVWSWLLATGLLLLLLILAAFQYRWLEEVRRADRDKSRKVLHAAVTRFADDFDRELTRAFLFFQAASPRSEDFEGFARRYERWRAVAPTPDLVRDVYLARRGTEEAFDVARLDPEEGTFVAGQWPAEMEDLASRLGNLRRHPRGEGPGGFPFLADDVPALILPMFGGPPIDESERPRGSGANPERRGGPPPGTRGFVVVQLDLEIIRDVMLAQLYEQHLREGPGYDVRIWSLTDQRIIFEQGSTGGPIAPGEGDAGVGLFGLLPPEKLGTLEPEAGLRRRGEPEAEAPRRPRRPRMGDAHFYHRIYRFISTEESGRWRLEAIHPAGSLDASVARAHRRNLGISFGILLILGASLVLILGSTRRQQELARQQLDFVAGVTHELLTPLAAMRSAGQNLADGVVSKPDQVQRYGRLVDDEGRRLSNMVGQVLEFARMRSGHAAYTLERTALAPLVHAALAEYAPVLEEKGVQVELDLEDDLPDVMADAAALRRAVQNLIANAVKYGEKEAWIGLRAVAGGPQASEIRLSVEDHGPGIASADLPRLFEPFYRGRNGASEAIPGSGLGLSLIKHIVDGHGGRVTVETRQGEGSTFTLHLPAASDGAAEVNSDI